MEKRTKKNLTFKEWKNKNQVKIKLKTKHDKILQCKNENQMQTHSKNSSFNKIRKSSSVFIPESWVWWSEEKNGGDSELSNAEIIWREANEEAKGEEQSIDPLKHVLSTSNLCESLFSQQCKILKSGRLPKEQVFRYPQKLNEIFYLKANNHFWTHPSSIQEVLLTMRVQKKLIPKMKAIKCTNLILKILFGSYDNIYI